MRLKLLQNSNSFFVYEKEKVKVKNIIALCHILDLYEKFIMRARCFFDEVPPQTIYDLIKLNKKESFKIARYAKYFYKENQKALQIIQEYSSID